MRRLVSSVVLASLGTALAEEKPPAIVRLPSGRELLAELAIDDASRTKGLMFRKEAEFGPDRAMVFLFPRPDILPFWMKNVGFSIDILWLSPEMRIVHIEKEVPPCSREPCPLYSPSQKAQVVVELHRGTVEREELKVGDSLAIHEPGAEGAPIVLAPK